MKKLVVLIVIGFVTLSCRASSYAGNLDGAIPSRVPAVTDIYVSGNPGPLIVNYAMAGYEPSTGLDASTTYNITTEPGTMKIIGSIDSAMPNNTLLYIKFTAPAGASSTGWQTLSTSPVNLVTSIDNVSGTGLTISYRLHASVAAGVIASAQKTVTLTVAAE